MDGIIKMKICQIYTQKETLTQMQNFFENENFIQLSNFIESTNEALSHVKDAKFEKVYLPLICKFQKTKENLKIFDFFQSEKFKNYIESICSKKLELDSFSINKYKHQDFILLNDKQVKNFNTIEVFFDLTKIWDKKFGGTLTYTTKTDEIFYLEPCFNSLTVIFRHKDVLEYLKYINNNAKNKEIVRIEIKYKII